MFEKENGMGSYTKSFGSLCDGAVYADGMNKVDLRKDIRQSFIDIQKANTVTGMATGTTDLALIPLYVDPGIVDITRRNTPLVELIPRVTNYGRTAEFNQITGRGIVGYKQEDAALSEADDTYVRNSTAIKYQYQVGRVTGPALAASKPYLSSQYTDMVNLEVMNKAKSLRYCEEDAIINGNLTSSRTAYGAITTVVGNEFNGMINTSNIQSTDLSAASVSIANLRAIIKKARTADSSSTYGQGNPNLMVTDFGTVDNIKGLLQEYGRYNDASNTNLAWGIQLLNFEGLPVLPSQFMPVSTNAQRLLVLQTDTWQMRVMQDVTYEELAKTNDSYKFMLKQYEALICLDPYHNAMLYGIKD